MVSGVGKANAAGATSRALQMRTYSAVINLGIAGALPGSSLTIGQTVLATRSVFSDEGVLTSDGFLTCSQIGFPPLPSHGDAAPADPGLLMLLEPLIRSRGGVLGPIATVSTCSGTDALARSVAERTGAVAEAMEGAAVGLAAARFSDSFPRRGSPFAEARVISNTTGERKSQVWDIKRSLAALTELAAAIAELRPEVRESRGASPESI
jgi:futalosine hydrolase